MQAEWAQSIRDQCQDAEVAFFFKQWGGRTPKAAGRLLDDKIWDEMPKAENKQRKKLLR
jgi:protein gp37